MHSIGGFSFNTEEAAQKAQKELEGIAYIKENTKMDNPDVVLKLYQKLIMDNLFETPVGFVFLKELQDYLKTIPYIKSEDVYPISVETIKTTSKKSNKQSEKQKTNTQNYKKPFGVALFFAIVFAIIIGLMFAINIVSQNNTNILNYENEIIDKYEAWEQELEQREQEIKDWEEKHKEQ